MIFLSGIQIFWTVLIALFLIIEAATPQLVTIWFAAGCFCSLISASLGADYWLQFIIFVVVSTLLLIITRPLIKKIQLNKTIPTNVDRLIGKVAIVSETIDNINNVGLVKAEGQIWSAKSNDGQIINKDTKVEIIEITGVKLVVKPL